MGNVEYFVSRDDGETTGPFPTPDVALRWVVDELGMDPDAVEDGQPRAFYDTAVSLRKWYSGLVERHVTYSAMEYGMWLRAAKELTSNVDWLLFGFESVVDPANNVYNGQTITKGLAHLIDPMQIHTPEH